MKWMVISDTAHLSRDTDVIGCYDTVASVILQITSFFVFCFFFVFSFYFLSVSVNSEMFYSASLNPEEINMTPKLTLNTTTTARPMFDKGKENVCL
jgi:hypothetical protein